MDAKELNIAIYKSLAAKAAELFQRTKIDAGTYSAKELADGKKDKKALCWEMEDGKEEITISVGSFVCRFVASMVFTLLARFEKLVPAKERVKFTKCEETDGLVCSFTMDVPKSAIDAEKFVAKTNGYRPVMENVCIDIQGERLAASDGYKLATRPVSISNISGELLERRAFIRPNDLKNMVGRCEVRIYEKGNTCQTEVTTERGETYICECGGRFPNVDSIFWQPEENQAIRFADLKELKKIAKDAIKSECKLQIITEAGSKSARIVAHNYEEQCFEYSVLLSEPANYSCIVWIKPENLTPFFGDWTGELYIKAACSAFVLGSKSGYNLLMPSSPEEGKEIKDPEYSIKPVSVVEVKQDAPSIELHPERMEPEEKMNPGSVMGSPIEKPSVNLSERDGLVVCKPVPAIIQNEQVSLSNRQIIAAIWLLVLFAIGRRLVIGISPISLRINIPLSDHIRVLLSPCEIHIREPVETELTIRLNYSNNSIVYSGHVHRIFFIYMVRGPDVAFNLINIINFNNTSFIIMALGLFIWIVLIIVILGGFEALVFIAASLVVTFIIGLIMAANKQKTSKNGE